MKRTRHPFPAPRVAHLCTVWSTLRIGLVAALSSCSSAALHSSEPDAASPTEGASAQPPPDAPAITYATLFRDYFAKGTPGHCASPGCHADPGANVWSCDDEAGCYQGMIDVGLIDPDHPARSMIIDPRLSPLTWINPSGGTMPLDAQGENAAGRAALEAWIASGAPRQ